MTPNEHHLKSRRIFLFADINLKSARIFCKQLRYLSDISDSPIYVYINSPGGDITQQDCIVDEILGAAARGLEVYLIGQGEICSSAAHILTMGVKGYRYMTANAIFMLHPTSIAISSDYAAQQGKYMEFMKKKEVSYYKDLAKACGKTLKKLEEDVRTGLWLTAKEAVRYGAIDDIWTFKHECGDPDPNFVSD